MKRIFLTIGFILLLFSVAMTVEASIREKNYISGFAGFRINPDFETDIHALEYNDFQIYQIDFKTEMDFRSFQTSLSAKDHILIYDFKELKTKEFFADLNRLMHRDIGLTNTDIRSDRIKVYTFYKSDDFRLSADILITIPEKKLCYLLIDYK